MTDWKKDFANEAEKALNHELVKDVIEEFLGNIQRHDSLTKYGIHKIGSYVAQVARAQALGIDPDTLRMNDDEVMEHMERITRIAIDAGKDVIVVVDKEKDR